VDVRAGARPVGGFKLAVRPDSRPMLLQPA